MILACNIQCEKSTVIPFLQRILIFQNLGSFSTKTKKKKKNSKFSLKGNGGPTPGQSVWAAVSPGIPDSWAVFVVRCQGAGWAALHQVSSWFPSELRWSQTVSLECFDFWWISKFWWPGWGWKYFIGTLTTHVLHAVETHGEMVWIKHPNTSAKKAIMVSRNLW